MGHHHKSNAQVEGDPDFGHGRGMPLRPDDTALDERTRAARREAGLITPERSDTQTRYEEVRTEIDREAAQGELLTGDSREAYPPARYDG
ncbi:hypothetical protein NX794_16275 [Streptomyces sp. LP11]|uniref:Uncharacterized protein n=1 Tax=Streptomyces pyxinicus TaxID=2970331 RepID=A0ABT2B2N1_9ACTN|nr:hypothetical protein [Streptomyces sp. LP11]MCS0602756.1 hypothetical protein [Streptomyces sp. LP11]